MEILKGVAASNGIMIGKAFVWTGGELPDIPRYTFRRKDDCEKEWARFLRAIEDAVKAKEERLEQLSPKSDKTEIDILKTHVMMLEDIELHEQVHTRLFEENENAEWAVNSISRTMVQTLFKSRDAYLRERAVDIADIANEIIYRLMGIERVSLSKLKENVIVVAHDIMPSDTITMDKKHIQALALDMGSVTSHTAILARSFEIPAVLGLGAISHKVKDGDCLIVDADRGVVFINPDEKTIAEHQKAIKANQASLNKLVSMCDKQALSTDGVLFSLKANIELSVDISRIYKYGAEGIGLFRSEFLFLTPGVPAGEEAQYQAYSKVIKKSNGLPVTIRTSDVGGDKILPNFYDGEEKNPLLGWRAIRLSLATPEVFKTQLRAILRAGVHGPARVMFPMIASVDELEQALVMLEEAKAECEKNNQKFDSSIKAGTMIEVPSAALIAGKLAKMVDFFSIGTNDLVQYTLAVDRGNEKVSYLADPRHPAVLRLIKMTVDAAQEAGIPAAVCGQIAGDSSMIPLLAGLGITEFSMNATAIPKIKSVLCTLNAAKCRKLAESALNCGTADEVSALFNKVQ